MGTTRDERRQRSEQARDARTREERGRVLRRRLIVAAVVLALIPILYATTRRGRADGRVWSAEHGHWHDR